MKDENRYGLHGSSLRSRRRRDTWWTGWSRSAAEHGGPWKRQDLWRWLSPTVLTRTWTALDTWPEALLALPTPLTREAAPPPLPRLPLSPFPRHLSAPHLLASQQPPYQTQIVPSSILFSPSTPKIVTLWARLNAGWVLGIIYSKPCAVHDTESIKLSTKKTGRSKFNQWKILSIHRRRWNGRFPTESSPLEEAEDIYNTRTIENEVCSQYTEIFESTECVEVH